MVYSETKIFKKILRNVGNIFEKLDMIRKKYYSENNTREIVLRKIKLRKYENLKIVIRRVIYSNLTLKDRYTCLSD